MASRPEQPALDRAFTAERVALIGASDSSHYHRQILGNMEQLGLPNDRAFLVNPRRATVLGRPCYPNIAAVPVPVDLALVATSAPVAVEVVEECGRAGVPAVAILTDGFAEAGPEGRVRQQAL